VKTIERAAGFAHRTALRFSGERGWGARSERARTDGRPVVGAQANGRGEFRGRLGVYDHGAGPALYLCESHALVATLHRQALAVLMRGGVIATVRDRMAEPHLLREQQHGSQCQTRD